MSLREGEHPLHGMQTWVALPTAQEDTAPEFQHYAATAVPQVRRNGARARVIAGRASGEASPVRVFADTLHVALDLTPDAEILIPPSHAERALYVLESDAPLDGADVPARHLAVLSPGSPAILRAKTNG